MTESRKPLELKSPGMRPLSRLPVFLALDGRRALVAGGNGAAAWKAELLSAAGAAVDVYAVEVCNAMSLVAAEPPRGPVTLHRRAWMSDDLRGAAIAVGAFDDDASASEFTATARTLGVPVNVIDRPRFCDFAFGSIVNRSPLVIGISTDGAAPVFAQAIRSKLEAMLPAGFALWAATAKRWRAAVQNSGMPFDGRRSFWHAFTALAITNPERPPADSDFDDIMAALKEPGRERTSGMVTLVGAGPGDPELLTLRAVRVLQTADVILFDDLVSREVLEFARREAKKMLVGKTGYGPSCRQDDINALMVGLAKSGKRIVRLKGGDPLIFGRAGEELAACRAAGIAVEVVPGITAAQGAASRLAIPLTDRKQARRLHYVTGHGRDGTLPASFDWRSLADPETTTAIYMPVHTLAELAAKAIAEGLDPDTPAIAVASATRPNQRVVATTISDLPRRLLQDVPHGPVVVMVGRACSAMGVMSPPAYERPRAHSAEST